MFVSILEQSKVLIKNLHKISNLFLKINTVYPKNLSQLFEYHERRIYCDKKFTCCFI